MKVKILLVTGLLTVFGMANAQDDDFFEMSLEEMMNMEITSASKKAESIKNVPSSMYVITANDIERSAATNIMELLRDVPGYWAVSEDYLQSSSYIRNSDGGSVLILLDGTPLIDLMFSDFKYNNFDIPLTQISRIEVIKGSGGTVYGANSATGVISIFTKNPEENAKVFADVRAAYPGYADANVGLNTQFNEKLSGSIYGKFGYFGGYDQISQTESDSYVIPGTDQTVENRYTEDDNTVTMMSGGIGLDYKASDKFNLSARVHANAINRNMYNQYYNPATSYLTSGNVGEPIPVANDSTYFVESNNSRIVGNLKGEYNFSEKHSLFARISSNYENSHYATGGGFKAKNGIVDLEIQDNFELSFNQFSIGGNVRSVNYNISDLYSSDGVTFTDYKRSERLIGLFAQDKISIIEDKLFAYIGVKAENFSLLNDNFYFSPMAKLVYAPSEKFTVWGGYTKSYTTPGYNQTDIEFPLFRAPSPEVFYDFAQPQVTQGVYMGAVQQFTDMGFDDATSQAMAQAFVDGAAGQYVIDSVTNQMIAGEAAAFPGHYNAAAINGPETEPTSFSNFELGIRLQPLAKLYFETNLFYSQFDNGIINSSLLMDYLQPSPTRAGENILPTYYGNYVKGVNYGAETILKYVFSPSITAEVSHTYFQTERDYKENNDFDISTLSSGDADLVNEEYPVVPNHVIRAKFYFDLPSDFRITLGGLYSTSFRNTFGTLSTNYEWDYQRFTPLANNSSSYRQEFGKHDSRTIVNLRIDKYLLGQQLNVFVFANDIFNDGMVESVNQLQVAYPRQVSRMIGFGAAYKLK